MQLFDSSYAAGAQEALLKFAATRAHKEILKSMQSGDMARANRLATTPGLLTDSPRAQQLGHQLKDLGRGGEGLATAVAHPTHGAAARKIFDPTAGVYSPTIVKRKEQLGGNVEGAAKLLGTSQTQHGTPVHFNEYVPGKQVTRDMMLDPAFAQKFEQAKARTQASGRQQGRELHDLRPANAMRTPQGDVKFVDTMPFNRDEVLHPSVERAHRESGRMRENQLPLSGKGVDLLPNMGDTRPGTSTPQFKQYMLGGKPPTGTHHSTFAALNTMAPTPTAAPGPLPPQTMPPQPPPLPPSYSQPPPLGSSSGSSLFASSAGSLPNAPTQMPLANAPTAPSVQASQRLPTQVSRKRPA